MGQQLEKNALRTLLYQKLTQDKSRQVANELVAMLNKACRPCIEKADQTNIDSFISAYLKHLEQFPLGIQVESILSLYNANPSSRVLLDAATERLYKIPFYTEKETYASQIITGYVDNKPLSKLGLVSICGFF